MNFVIPAKAGIHSEGGYGADVHQEAKDAEANPAR